ncbi:MAG: hypothetical protein OEW08_12380 [Gammaproteobacteria bacterium]|nr:hypothetical protein [Gammaproteobacteria bacterium]
MHYTTRDFRVRYRSFHIFMTLSIVLTLSACDIGKSVDKVTNTLTDSTSAAVNVLDDAIGALNQQSSSWQSVLTDTIGKLTTDTQSTIRNEVSDLLSRGVGTAGAEVRCDADFIGNRVREGLIRIKAKLLGQTVPPAQPVFCQIVPLAVDRSLVPQRLNKMEFYGYNFDTVGAIKVSLEGAGTKADVTDKLDKPTHYAMTLKFGANGVQLNDKSQRFIVELNGIPFSTIGVIQPQTPVCKTKVQTIDAGKVTFVPPHTRGDTEFGGHGPNVYSKISLQKTNNALSSTVYMKAVETKSDWTTAEGSKEFPLYTVDPGWRINSIVGTTSTSHNYTDSNHTNDVFNLGAGGPVSRLVYVGDTDGKEAGTRTQVEATFNPIRLELVETADCVSAQAVMSLQKSNLISDAVKLRLAPSVGIQMKLLQQ